MERIQRKTYKNLAFFLELSEIMPIFAASVIDMLLCTFRSKNVCSGYPGKIPRGVRLYRYCPISQRAVVQRQLFIYKKGEQDSKTLLFYNCYCFQLENFAEKTIEKCGPPFLCPHFVVISTYALYLGYNNIIQFLNELFYLFL